jgi:hypothetical protein
MADPKRIVLPYKELVEFMIKKNDLHEGIWALFARFGLNVMNAAVEYENASQLRPVAIVPLVEIGLQEGTQLHELSLDAAVVNPRRKAGKKAGAKKKAKK